MLPLHHSPIFPNNISNLYWKAAAADEKALNPRKQLRSFYSLRPVVGKRAFPGRFLSLHLSRITSNNCNAITGEH